MPNMLMDAEPELSSFTNNDNESALFLAISKGFPKIGSCILDRSSKSISFERVNGVTALHAAVTHISTCKDIVKKMVAKNKEMVKEIDELGWTPLHYAAFKGNIEAIKLLMEPDSSAAAYMLDKCGMSALHIAAHTGWVKAMKELLRLRPDTSDLLNHKGQNVLHAAVLGEKIRTTKYIFKTPELSALVNEADKDGNTPLHLAAFIKNTNILGILARNRKVDKSATNNHHSKAVDVFIGDKIDVTFGTGKILRCFGRTIGVPIFQRYLSRDLQPLAEEVSSRTASKAKDISEKILFDDSKNFDTSLLVAMLIASVTFSAAVNMPGGFNAEGMAVRHRNTFFYLFVLFDSISFILSLFSVFNYFMVSTNIRDIIIAPYTPTVCIRYSIAAMALAFASGVFVVLPKYSPPGILILLTAALYATSSSEGLIFSACQPCVSSAHEFGSVLALFNGDKFRNCNN